MTIFKLFMEHDRNRMMEFRRFFRMCALLCAAIVAWPPLTAKALGVFPSAAQSAHIAVRPFMCINNEDPALVNAEKFVTQVADRGIAFLGDSSLSQAQRKDKFQALLKDNFDMKIIARFALGRYWRTATDAQRHEYLALFERMILNVYARRFGEYQGEALIVRDSRPEGARDVLVHSTVTPQSGPEIAVDWRIRKTGSAYKVIDVIVEGVSMSLTQRSDFSSVIQRGGGNVETLLVHLRERAE